MVPHEGEGRRRHAAGLGGAVAVFDHACGQRPEQQREQVVRVAAHQRPGEKQGLARLGGEHAHGLTLGRPGRLVLMAFVHHQKVEEPLGKIALDEFRRLVSAFAETELHRGHRAFHAMGLPVGKHQLAFLVHQVDELEQVVAQERDQERLAERLHQTLGRGLPDGRYPLEGLDDGRRLVGGGQRSRPHQRPQRGCAMAALAARFFGLQFGRWDGFAIEVGDGCPAMGAGPTGPLSVRRWTKEGLQ